jgi:hypothetical protein
MVLFRGLGRRRLVVSEPTASRCAAESATVSRRIQAFLQDRGRYGLQEVALLGVTGASTPLRPSGMHPEMHTLHPNATQDRYPESPQADAEAVCMSSAGQRSELPDLSTPASSGLLRGLESFSRTEKAGR